jgi:NDP-sugar pyrophosphorylase family protein
LEVIILAGGDGSRLRPLTRERPKILMRIGMKTILQLILEWLLPYQPDHVHLCLGKNAQPIRDFLGTYNAPFTISHQIEKKPLGTGGALLLAKACGDWREKAIVINGDLLTDLDLTTLIAAKNETPIIALINRQDGNNKDFGCVELDNQSSIIRKFHEKKRFTQEVFPVNAGVYYMAPNDLLGFVEGSYYSLEHDIFPQMILEERLKGCIVQATGWWDMGVPERYLAGQEWALINGLAIKGAEEIQPGIFLENGSSWGKECRFESPVLIRRGCRIGEGVNIGPNVVLDEGCWVGRDSIIRDVYIGQNSRFGKGCRVRESLFDEEVSLDEGVWVERICLGARSRLLAETRSWALEG